MKIFKIVFSFHEPKCTECLWLTTKADKFVLMIFNNGKWRPIQLCDCEGECITDDEVDAKITEATEAIIGKDTDTATDLTLYGLKAYVDSVVNNIE